MNELQRRFIVAHLNLYMKIGSLDQTISDDIDIINEAFREGIVEESSLNSIEATITRFISSSLNKESAGFLKEAINALECLKDKDYLNYLIILNNIQENKSEGSQKNEIRDILSRDLKFSDDKRIFEVYYTISNLAIATRDNELIAEAINKVQSLQVKE